MQSMTGFGRGSAQVADEASDGELVVEIRAVNHRFLDTRLRLGTGLNELAPFFEDILRKRLVRGHIELGARVSGGALSEVRLDKARARRALTALDELRDDLGLSEPVPLSLLGVVPDLFVSPSHLDRGALRHAAQRATEAACRDLQALRETEGQALAADLRIRAQHMQELARGIVPQCESLAARHRQRLLERIEKLLQGTGVAADPGRLELEVAIAADKHDVSEELTRLQSHLTQLLSLIEGHGALGRKLDFLLQELGREINTIGSKASDLAVTNTVLALKAELERVREQAHNVL